jgi:NADH-quinone oxidoreductase subunit H
MVLLVFLGLPAAFVGVTAAFYALAALGERALLKWFGVPGGGGAVNSVTLMVLMLMVFAGLLTLAERKWSGAMQDRIGPNRANIGSFRWGGLPHFLADALKMIFKEDFTPERASKFLFSVAPALVFVPAMLLFAVVPVAPPIYTSLHGLLAEPVTVALQVAAPDFGVLFVFAFASLAVYGTTIAGWASNNKLALLGAVRASSQMIGYEVALGLSLVGMMLTFSTVRLDAMSALQGTWLWGGTGAFDVGLPAWGIFLQPIGFLLFFAAAFAETKRAPFDMPEGESEIVGYFVEYSGLKFGLFMISEFVEVVVLSGVITAIFLGGYHLPFGERWLQMHIGPNWLATLQGATFWVKVLIMCWLQLTVRWTFPRFRYDQVQKLCWKMLLPLGLANIFVSGALVLLDRGDLRLLALAGILEIVVMVAVIAVKPKPAAVPQVAEAAAHGHAAGH